jgi:hypothetical protein
MNGSRTTPILESCLALTLHFSRREDDTTYVLAQALGKAQAAWRSFRACERNSANPIVAKWVARGAVEPRHYYAGRCGLRILYNRLAMPR